MLIHLPIDESFQTHDAIVIQEMMKGILVRNEQFPDQGRRFAFETKHMIMGNLASGDALISIDGWAEIDPRGPNSFIFVVDQDWALQGGVGLTVDSNPRPYLKLLIAGKVYRLYLEEEPSD